MLLEEIRQLEVQTNKGEARLEGLREANIDVDKWLQKAEKCHSQNERVNSSANELTPGSFSELLLSCKMSTLLIFSGPQLMVVSLSSLSNLPSLAHRILMLRHHQLIQFSLDQMTPPAWDHSDQMPHQGSAEPSTIIR